MAEFRVKPEPNADKRAKFGARGVVSITGGFLALLFGLLFASGYWNENARRTDTSPRINVRVVGAPLPGVVVEQVQAGAGTMKLPVDPPTADVSRGFVQPAMSKNR